jgi:hypothetical protein
MKQQEFKQGDWEKFLETELGKAIAEFTEIKTDIEYKKDKLKDVADKVLIEMQKNGQDYLRPQINGVFYEFEITSGAEKLKFKLAKVI